MASDSVTSSSDEDEADSPQIRFLSGVNGGKVLVMDNEQMFYLNKYDQRVSRTQYSYFKCAFAKSKGCQASLTLQNFDLDKGTYDSFKIIKREHRNHEPCIEKIRKLEGRKEDLETKAREFDPSLLKKCRHVCLFCCVALPAGYQKATALENVTTSGDILAIRLDNREENAKAFEAFCKTFGVRNGKWKDELFFEEGDLLPLCFACQTQYQEMWQLRKQVEMLEELIDKYVELIRGTVSRTERLDKVGGTQLMVLGLDIFRKLVVHPNYRIKKYGTGNNDVLESKSKVITLAGKSVISKSAPKEEFPNPKFDTDPSQDNSVSVDEEIVIKEEMTLLHDLGEEEDTLHEPMWMNSGGHQDDSSSLPSSPRNMDEDSINVSNDFVGASSETSSDCENQAMLRKSRVRASRLIAESKIKENVDQPESPASLVEDDDKEDADVCEDDLQDSDSDFEVKKSTVRTRSMGRRPSTSASLYARLSKKNRIRSRACIAKKQYTCHICSAMEVGYNAFVDHYNQHHPEEKRYTCVYCKKHYRDLRDITVHQRTHTGERPFKCTECTSTFTSRRCLVSHVQLCHTDRSDVKFPCSQCDNVFPTKTQLTNHLTAEHDYVPKKKISRKYGHEMPIKPFTCHLCNKTLLGQGPFLQHYKEVHPDENRYTCKYCQKHYRDLRDCARHQRKHTGERPYKCDDCDKAFRCEKSLRAHCLHIHSNQAKEFICPTCGKQFISKNCLSGHMNVHSEHVILCLACGKSFRHPSNFCKHNRLMHHGKAKHSEPITDQSQETLESIGIPEAQPRMKCHICWEPILGKVFLARHFEECHPDHQGGLTTCKCGKQFKQYKDCCKHAIRHSEHKRFHCDQCPSSFFTSTELRLHIERHAPIEERQNNTCDICGLNVVSLTALNRHKKKQHETQKIRSVCEVCGRSYAEKKGLYHHMRTEHLKILPHKCTHCGKGFALRGDLEKHSRTHTGAKPFKCELCDKRFPYTSSRARHMREVHDLGDQKGPTPRKKKRAAKRNPREAGEVLEEHNSASDLLGVSHYSQATPPQTQAAGRLDLSFMPHPHYLSGIAAGNHQTT